MIEEAQHEKTPIHSYLCFSKNIVECMFVAVWYENELYLKVFVAFLALRKCKGKNEDHQVFVHSARTPPEKSNCC